MRRLKIAWSTSSKALDELKQVLEQYGHIAGAGSVDLIIEDGGSRCRHCQPTCHG